MKNQIVSELLEKITLAFFVCLIYFVSCQIINGIYGAFKKDAESASLPQKLALQKRELHELEELLLMQMKMYCTQVSGSSSHPSWEGDELVCLKASRD